MKKNAGFTLIELMIVVAIIAIIAAIALPNLLRSRLQSNESATIGNLRTITAAEVAYNAATSTYATAFATLTGATPPYLNGTWATKSGYNYVMGGAAACFTVTAAPVTVGQTGSRYFFTQCDGVIRYNAAAAAGAGDTPIGE